VEVQVYDYVDSSVPMLAKMHEKRMKGFKAMGYEQESWRDVILVMVIQLPEVFLATNELSSLSWK
jgi:hypothetical protein